MDITTTSKKQADQVRVDLRDQNRDFQSATVSVYDDSVVIRVNYNDLEVTLPRSVGISLLRSASEQYQEIEGDLVS
jgi:hypothetical protein